MSDSDKLNFQNFHFFCCKSSNNSKAQIATEGLSEGGKDPELSKLRKEIAKLKEEIWKLHEDSKKRHMVDEDGTLNYQHVHCVK